MTSGLRRTVLAAAFGLMGGSALAQAPAAVPAQPAPMPPAAQPVPAAPAVPVAPAHSSPFVALPAVPGCGSPGCDPAWNACVPTAPPKASLAARLFHPFTIGEGCANPVTCGNFASERTFIFGSCKQFFNAGNKCGHGWGLRSCAAYPQGCGGLGDHNNCNYGTALNR